MSSQGAPPPTYLTGTISVRMQIEPLDVTYHLVTPEQIETYARLGYLFEGLSWFFGVAVGVLTTTHLELTRGGLSGTTLGAFGAYREAALVTALVTALAGLAVVTIRLRNKRSWRSTIAEISP